MIPPYFEIEDPWNWRASRYIHHCLSPSASAKYGLRFLSRESPPEVTARVHGQNVLQWIVALKELAGPQSPQTYPLRAMKQLASHRRSKILFSNWYARTVRVAHKKRTEADASAARSGVVDNTPTESPSPPERLACNSPLNHEGLPLPQSQVPQPYPNLEGREEDADADEDENVDEAQGE